VRRAAAQRPSYLQGSLLKLPHDSFADLRKSAQLFLLFDDRRLDVINLAEANCTAKLFVSKLQLVALSVQEVAGGLQLDLRLFAVLKNLILG
jgi:hypothetical protein